jgi:hypothetical protein
MPRIVYGILGQHRSHRIENPDPARDAEAGRPNACTLCHLDRSPVWAAARMAEWWGPKYRSPGARPDGASPDLPDAIASLAAGDPVQRSIFARALGRPDRAGAARDLAFARVHLIAALADAYPSVRFTAQRSLLALERELPLGMTSDLERFPRDARQSERTPAVRALFAELARRAPGRCSAPRPDQLLAPDFTPRLDELVPLLRRQAARAIDIGE